MVEIDNKIAVTGANGFVGQALLTALTGQGRAVRPVVRTSATGGAVAVGDIGPATDWSAALDGVDIVVHTAARVHVMNEGATDPLTAFREVNVDGTLNLAQQAAEAGVRRLVFISSIKVNGEQTVPGTPFLVSDPPAPEDAYGLSKWEAEQALWQMVARTGLELVVVRPPLVYGPGVKGNFLAMLRWLDKGVPLPLGLIHNQRSLVALDNLVDLLMTCIDHPAAANQTFLVADGDDLSTTELLRRTAMALGRPARLLPVPQILLQAALKSIGKGTLAQRLCGSLQVDLSKAHELLGWTPSVTVDEALRKTAQAYLHPITTELRSNNDCQH